MSDCGTRGVPESLVAPLLRFEFGERREERVGVVGDARLRWRARWVLLRERSAIFLKNLREAFCFKKKDEDDEERRSKRTLSPWR